MEKTRTSFVAAVIPDEHNEPLLLLLKQYWPTFSSAPHITLVDPFLYPEHFPEAVEKFTAKLSTFAPFEIMIKGFGVFKNERGSILWMRPEDSQGKRQKVNHGDGILV